MITVCVDHDTVEKVKAATQAEHGTFAGELQGYSLQEGELQPLLKVQNAEFSVCVIDFDKDRALAVQAANSHAPDAARAHHADRAFAAIRSHADRRGHAGRLQRISEQAGVGRSRCASRSSGYADVFRASRDVKAAGKILAFLGCRGGAGTTTLAVHLGSFLAHVVRQESPDRGPAPAPGTRGFVPGARCSLVRFLRTGAQRHPSGPDAAGRFCRPSLQRSRRSARPLRPERRR